jgi:hypothetical protein
VKAALLVPVASTRPKIHAIINTTAAIDIFPELPSKKSYKLLFT